MSGSPAGATTRRAGFRPLLPFGMLIISVSNASAFSYSATKCAERRLFGFAKACLAKSSQCGTILNLVDCGFYLLYVALSIDFGDF